MSFWAVTSYFNPVRYNTRLMNYKIFRKNLQVPLLTIEISADGNFDLTSDDADILIQISGGAVLWQRQRLLNVALKSVPAKADKIAWLDCDIIFNRSDWVDYAEAELRKNCIIQLCSDAVLLRPGEDSKATGINSHYETRVGIVKKCLNGDLDIIANSRGTRVDFTMLAWAARREIIEKIGFYDAAIVGGGDMFFLAAIYGKTQFPIDRFSINPLFKKHYLDWANRIPESVINKVGYIDCELSHLWHGETKDRNRDARWKILEDFDPYEDVVVSQSGAWEFTSIGERLEAPIKNFFISRREDG
jgi:hypothetical protein